MSRLPRSKTPRPSVAADTGDDPIRSLVSADGLGLHSTLDMPGGPPRAILLFVHGLAEHSGRYRDVIDHFRPLGFACASLDLRGHGRSEGERVHVDSFDDYGLDVAAGVAWARDQLPGRPLFLVGHSMGGVIAIRTALDHPETIDGLVLSSPGLASHPETRPPAWLAAIAGIVSAVAPRKLFATGLDPDAVSRDPDIVRAYRADPLIGDRVSARWYTAFRSAQQDAFERAAELRVPALLMQSGDDRLVDPEATRRWADSAPHDLVSFYTWPGFYHEMFHEPEKLRVYELAERWLEERLTGRI